MTLGIILFCSAAILFSAMGLYVASRPTTPNKRA
jgi:hypothetical protein